MRKEVNLTKRMSRDSWEWKKIQYFKNLSIRKFYPRFLYYKCDKCEEELIKEAMYECAEPSIIGCSWNYHKYGCSHCFDSIDGFQNWLIKSGKILVEDDFNVRGDLNKMRKLLF